MHAELLQHRASMPPRIGRYEVLARLGGGATCDVYHARETWAERRHVALKELREGASAEQTERFRADLRCNARMPRHPGLVAVYDTNAIDSPELHYTMQLATRGSLVGVLASGTHREPQRAAELVATLARALHFLHGMRPALVHGDIRPTNILLGEDGQALLGDVRSHHPSPRDMACPYRAPELRRGAPPTPSSDIYSLGVVLHELLLGRTPGELPARVSVEGSRDLGAIVTTALGRTPGRRYASAAELADDLDRFRRGEPAQLVLGARWRRMGSWLRREPLLGAAILATVVALTVLVAGAVLVVQLPQQEHVRRTLQTLEMASRVSASFLLDDLEDASMLLASTAREVERELRERPPEQVDLKAHSQRMQSLAAVDSITVHDKSGTARARSVPVDGVIGTDYHYRDYNKSAAALGAAGAHIGTIARAHVLNPGKRFTEFPLVAPMYDADEKFAWALLALTRARSDLWRAGAERRDGEFRIVTAVYGLKDLGTADAPAPSEQRPGYLLVTHPEMRPDDKFELSPRFAARLFKHFKEPASVAERFLGPSEEPIWFDDFIDQADPVRGRRWLAVFAPIGRTGYVVSHQVPFEHAFGPSQRVDELVRRESSLALLVVGLLWACAGLRALWRRRHPRVVN